MTNSSSCSRKKALNLSTSALRSVRKSASAAGEGAAEETALTRRLSSL